MIEANGGKNLAGVSANTTYLLAGAKIGPAKLQKAQKLGIKIISEQELLAMIEGATPIAETPNAPETSAEPAPAPQPVQGSLF